MRFRPCILLLALASLRIASPGLPARAESAGGTVAHRLTVGLDPGARQLAVDDRILLLGGGAVEFLLNKQLEISSSDPRVEEVPLGDVADFLGNNTGEGTDVGLRRYRVRLPEGGGKLHLTYSGKFDFGLGTQQEEYQRGFRNTAGIVSPEGVYLAGNGHWYPQFTHSTGENELVEFELTAHSPEGWHLLSQGNGTSRDELGFAHWSSGGAMDEIYLVGGPLVRYHRTVPAVAGVVASAAVDAEVYLRQDDAALAGKYLQATAQYLEMYSRLIGPYPYGKFALVENFWETGFGMASFTLLGPQVIRMPFILTSSYPHEILHNWWGNSVFVDYASGNWCEGLTAYMADHLLQEQRGQGEAHRRDRLQDYASYVRHLRDGRDFPLVEFRSRHSAATEAVGYGKTLMGFHMLRRKLGDDRFRAWAARFYREMRGRQASFADVRRTMEALLSPEPGAVPGPVPAPASGNPAGADLGRFFRDWTERPGAAALAVEVAEVAALGAGFEVRGTLRQTQGGEPFALDVPLAIQTAGATVVESIHLESAATPFAIRVPARPLALQADPSFDLFRRLDPREIPPSIGQIFGEPRLLAVVAASASPAEAAAWRTLALAWQTEAHAIEVVTDAEVQELPADRAVWLLGRDNRLAARYFGSASGAGNVAGLAVDETGVGVDGQRVAFAGHTTVVVVRHPASAERAIGWITVDPALLAALPGLGRKLPHYGKYSYLGFAGTEPTNKVKGQWAATDSPLRLDLRSAAERTPQSPPLPALVLAPRQALAELPPTPSKPPAPPAPPAQSVAPAQAVGPAPPSAVVVRLTTALGEIDLEIDSVHAPVSAANFLRSVDAGRYDGGRFHRTVRPDNETRKDVAIEVIQGGVAPEREKDELPPIALERTTVTGLKHRDGTLSMARAEPDTATSDFFICIGDQPLLDFGGARNPDGQGFAAFGKVVRGMEIVRQIQAAPAAGQALTPPVQILTARRLP